MAPERTQFCEHRHQHDNPGDKLHRKLHQFRDRSTPQPPASDVEQRERDGDEDARHKGNARENIQDYCDRGPFRADIEKLEREAAPGEQLLRRSVVPYREIFQGRRDLAADSQPGPPGCNQESTGEHRQRHRKHQPDVKGEPVGISYPGMGYEYRCAIPGHVVKNSRQPPRHPAARGKKVLHIVDPPVGPDPDRGHRKKIESQYPPVESRQVLSFPSVQFPRRLQESQNLRLIL